jgi:hypothetical protein
MQIDKQTNNKLFARLLKGSKFYIICIFLLVLAVPSYGADTDNITDTKTTKKSVIIIPIQTTDINSVTVDILQNNFLDELNKYPIYDFLSGNIYKDAFEAVMKEQKQECVIMPIGDIKPSIAATKQEFDVVKCVRRVADQFGINLVIATNIIKDGNTYIIDAAINDILTGSQRAHDTESCSHCSKLDLINKMKTLAEKLASQIGGIGFLTVTGTPEGAEVYVSDKKIGVLPMIYHHIHTGKSIMKIVSPSYNASNQEIIIKDNEETKIKVNLIKKKFKVKLTVKNPEGNNQYDIYLDNKKKPVTLSSLEELIEGTHTIEIRAGKMAGITEITGHDGEVKDVIIDLKERDYINRAIDLNYLNLSLGIYSDLFLKETYASAEYSLALDTYARNALAFSVFSNKIDTGIGLTYKIALGRLSCVDKGLWLGLGVDAQLRPKDSFIMPKVELGYSYFIISGFAIGIYGYAGVPYGDQPDIHYGGELRISYSNCNNCFLK